jgi:hypothetical protein
MMKQQVGHNTEALLVVTLFLLPHPSATTDFLREAAIAEEVPHVWQSITVGVLSALGAVVHRLVVLCLHQRVVRNRWPLRTRVARTTIKETRALVEVIL